MPWLKRHFFDIGIIALPFLMLAILGLQILLSAKPDVTYPPPHQFSIGDDTASRPGFILVPVPPAPTSGGNLHDDPPAEDIWEEIASGCRYRLDLATKKFIQIDRPEGGSYCRETSG